MPNPTMSALKDSYKCALKTLLKGFPWVSLAIMKLSVLAIMNAVHVVVHVLYQF